MVERIRVRKFELEALEDIVNSIKYDYDYLKDGISKVSEENNDYYIAKTRIYEKVLNYIETLI